MKHLNIIIKTSKETMHAILRDGDTLDVQHNGKTDIFLELNNDTLTIKNASLIEKERKP